MMCDAPEQPEEFPHRREEAERGLGALGKRRRRVGDGCGLDGTWYTLTRSCAPTTPICHSTDQRYASRPTREYE